MKKLKPCPFCGSISLLTYSLWGEVGVISCTNCFAEGPSHDSRALELTFDESKDRAITDWNRRA